MGLEEFVKLLRSRWITVSVTAILTIAGAAAYTLLQTPLYESNTRLFVSTTSGESTTDLYQGSRYSQERVLSYSQLATGETLAQRTIDRLDLDMGPDELAERVTAKSKPNTVLIDIAVVDESPVRARDIANALSDELVTMIGELETPASGQRPEARVVVEQRASVPQKPVVPKRTRNIAVGVILGGILGIGLAFLRDQLDNTIKNPAILEEVSGASVVGHIPFDSKFQDTAAITFDKDHSPASEAFRKLRTNLHFLSVDNPPRIVVVTSSLPNEGKSTTAINLALALAEAEHNVLLVDGDLRRPSLHEYLGLIGKAGLSNVLSGTAELDEVLQASHTPRLTVLSAGASPPNPSELLGSQAATKTISELRSRFDYVVIDTSPLLAVTDAAILSTKADGTLIVARAGKTKREQLAHAISALRDVGATVLGAVLTMMPTRGRGIHSYGYYYYSKGYAEEPTSQSAAGKRRRDPNKNPGDSVVKPLVPTFEPASDTTDQSR